MALTFAASNRHAWMSAWVIFGPIPRPAPQLMFALAPTRR